MERACFFRLVIDSADSWIILLFRAYFLYKNQWLFLSGASIPSHHYLLSIGKRSDTLYSTQKRVSDRPTHQRRQDCCAVHESACIGSDHLRPAATLVGERAIDVREQQLSVCALGSLQIPPSGYVVTSLATALFPAQLIIRWSV